MLPVGGTVVAFCKRILALSMWNLQMSWCKCPGAPWGQPPGMAADKCISLIGLLQQTITWYKIRHAGGQAHYYSCRGTLKQRPVILDWLRPLCFKVPVWE